MVNKWEEIKFVLGVGMGKWTRLECILFKLSTFLLNLLMENEFSRLEMHVVVLGTYLDDR